MQLYGAMNVNGHTVLVGVECETCIGVECRADWLDSCFCIILPCLMIRFFSPADLRLFSSISFLALSLIRKFYSYIVVNKSWLALNGLPLHAFDVILVCT